jgi:N-acetylmuramoyl-L-alanine amidase
MRRGGDQRHLGWAGIVLAVMALATSAAALLAGASTPVGAASAPIVVIDPGHDRYANSAVEPIGPGSSTLKIKDGGGTSGVVTHTPEAVVNLAVSKRLAALLRGAGIEVVMTRATTSHVSIGNVARAQLANRLHAAAFVRIHCDGGAPSATGTHTLYPVYHRGWTDDIYKPSLRLATLVQGELVRSLGFPNRGLDPRSDMTGFNWANVPAILPELGFLTNSGEDRVLNSSAGQNKAAVGMCRGILRFLGRSPASCD